jgi:hypothetical protein
LITEASGGISPVVSLLSGTLITAVSPDEISFSPRSLNSKVICDSGLLMVCSDKDTKGYIPWRNGYANVWKNR